MVLVKLLQNNIIDSAVTVSIHQKSWANDLTQSITFLEAHSARRGVLSSRIRDSAARPRGGGGLCIAVALDLS